MGEQKTDIENEEIQNITQEEAVHEQEIETEASLSEENEDSAKSVNVKKSGLFGKKDKKSKHPNTGDLKPEIEKLKTENAELQDKFLRLYSEFDNYRKRTQKEKLDVIQNASEAIIINLLPILDDMERAIKYCESTNADLNFVKEGEALIFQKMNNLLQQKGLKLIETKDVLFDTDYHETISAMTAVNEEDKGKIVEEIEKGYMLNNKVIRFSKVVIYQ